MPKSKIARVAQQLKLGLTAPVRALPDFIIIGAQKAGTTSLFSYLGRHPQVMPARAKEVHYFDLHFSKGPYWYRTHFPVSWKLKGPQVTVTGEATPDYLYHPHAPERIAAAVPNARLIVLLREPVARAYSHYHHERDRGREPIPTFEDAIAAEPERLATATSDEGSGDEYTPEHRRHSYLARGRYAEQLRRYFDRFPREQVLVLFSERFFADPQASYDTVLEFLGLAPDDLRRPEAKNVGTYDDRDSIPAEAELKAYFARPNRELADLLGTGLPW